MNPFYNPLFIGKVLNSYFSDIGRLYRFDENKLRKYQDQRLRKMVQYAFTVPLYHEKYTQVGIRPHDISGVKDLQKLPFITKDDITAHSPSGIISTTTRKERLIQVSTSGTTGKVLPIYVDMIDVIQGLFAYVRTLREYGMNIWKNRITIIGDFAAHTAESGYVTRGVQPRFNLQSMFKNIQWLNTNDSPTQVAEKINAFQPEFIGGYVGMLGHLALLKEQGIGSQIAPRFIAATGSVLDPFLKKFIENTFDATVFEVYGATESGLIGFECQHRSYHVMSDLVYPEFLRNGEPVSPGDAGEMVITKLYGRGTPMIRYNAINDIVAPRQGSCSCGMAGSLLQKVYGRNDLALYLPDGRVLLPSAFSEVYSRILYDLKTTALKNTKIIQHDLQTIEIQVVIEQEPQGSRISTAEICSYLQHGFQEKVGPSVTVTVTPVDSIDMQQGPRIISKVDKTNYKITQYL